LVLATTVAQPLPTANFGTVAMAMAMSSSFCVLGCNMDSWKLTEV
jgi:hypothetical protein